MTNVPSNSSSISQSDDDSSFAYPIEAHPSLVGELSSGLLSFFRPTIQVLDQSVLELKQSQISLENELLVLSEGLSRIVALKDNPIDLESYLQRLKTYKQRIVKLHNSLCLIQESIDRLKPPTVKSAAALTEPI